jgi:hypothetical protein
MPEPALQRLRRAQPGRQFYKGGGQAAAGADIRTSETEMPGNAHAPMCNVRLVQDLGFAPAYSLERGVADYIVRDRVFDRYHEQNS